MATNAKEITQVKTKSRSAPSTPSSSSQRKGLGPTETSDKDATTTSTQEKPIPNYLRPTISSGHNSKHQPSSQSKDKARIHKSPLPKTSKSPNSTPDKPASSFKTVKTAKAATTTSASSKSSISMGKGSPGATKKKEDKSSPRQAVKVLTVKSQSQEEQLKAESSPICDSAEKNEEVSNDNEDKQETILQHAASGESQAAGADDAGEDREVEGPKGAFKNEEAKEKGSPTVYNAVIEKTANKLVAGKRDKVRALVGAFETVMELEGQQSPQKGDKGKHVEEIQHTKEKEAETSQDIQDEETGQETQQVEVSQPKYEEQEEITEVEYHVEEQEGEAEEVSTESIWSDKNVVTESGEEEGSKCNTEQESTKVSSNGPREVMGSEDRKDASPKDGDSAGRVM